MKGLIVKKHWINSIFDDNKTWEIRGRNTKIRGKIYLIESGTGTIVGTVCVESTKKLSDNDLNESQEKHKIKDLSIIKYRQPYAWILKDAKRFDKVIPYKHPQGAVIWVNIV